MKKLMVIVAALAMISGSAYAADWNFYGSARVETFYTDMDNANDAFDKGNISESLQGNARIGANVKVSDELSGRFEYGASGGNANIRLLYGTWNFGAGALRVGQDYTPLYLPVSNQVYGGDNGLGGIGEPYPGRKAQLKLMFGGFDIALVQPNLDAFGTSAGEVKLPQIQAAYKLAMDNWKLALGAGYQTFDNAADESVSSYVITARGGVAFGGFTLGAEIFGGQNTGNLVSIDVNKVGGVAGNKGLAVYDNGGKTVVDNDAFGYEIVLGYTINDMFGLEAGYGYTKTELDVDGVRGEKDDVSAWYIQAPITLASGVFIIPEVGQIDYKGNLEDEITYYGAKWQINF